MPLRRIDEDRQEKPTGVRLRRVDESDMGSDVSMSDIGKGMVVETAGGIGSQVAGAALAPFTFGISYPVLAFSGGYASSIAAQKVEGQDDISHGRALVGGLVNLIPGWGAVKAPARVAASTLARETGKAITKKQATKLVGKEVAKHMGKQATMGAGLGVSQASAEAMIDEQRLPTMKELGQYGIAGGVFQGLFGGVFKTKEGVDTFKGLLGKTASEIDDLIASGKVNPRHLKLSEGDPSEKPLPDRAKIRRTNRAIDELADANDQKEIVKAVTDPPETLLGQIKERGKSIVAKIAPSAIVGKEVSRMSQEYRQEIRALEELGSRVSALVSKVAKKTPNAERDVRRFMSGASDTLEGGLSKIEPELRLARGRIAEMQDMLLEQIDLDLVATHNPEELGKLRAKIQASRDSGDYLTREYRFFTDKNYRPTAKQREAAINEIATRAIARSKGSLSPEDARVLAEKHIKHLDAHKLSAVDGRGWFGRSVDGVLRKKHNVGPAEREYLGEITEVGEQIRGTLSRVGRIVYRNNIDSRIKQRLIKMGVAADSPKTSTATELKLKSHAPETQVYVPQAVQDALDVMYIKGTQSQLGDWTSGALFDLYQAGVSLSKATKVLLNPPSYAVQMWGNVANLASMGANPFRNILGALRTSIDNAPAIGRKLSNLGNSKADRVRLAAEINDMARYGLRGVNVLESDVRSALSNGTMSTVMDKALDPFGRAYSVPDTMFRYVAWKNNEASLSKIFPQASEETIRKVAADVTNDTYQNYDRLSQSVKTLSRLGVLGQFASFTAEFIRNQYHQGRIIQEMLSGRFGKSYSRLGPPDLTEMAKEGSRRLAGAGLLYAGIDATLSAMREESGISEDQYVASKETIVPQYDKEKSLMMWRDGDNLYYANPSYIVPHTIGYSALEAGMNGHPIEGVGNLLASELLGEGTFIGKSFYQAINNRDLDTGRPISFKESFGDRAVEQIGFFINESFRPGFMREADKLDKAMREVGDLSVSDVGKRQLGVRINSLNIKESAQRTIRESSERMRLAKSSYSYARDNLDMSPQDLNARYMDSQSAYHQSLDVIHRHYTNLQKLGYNDEDRIEILKGAGVGTKDLLAVMTGIRPPLPRQASVKSSDVYDELSSLNDGARMKRIAEIGRSDPSMGKKLMAIEKRRRKSEALGMSEMDKLLMSLDSDGDRPRFLLDMMGGVINIGRMREWERKRIITPTVRQQIELMARMNKEAPAR